MSKSDVLVSAFAPVINPPLVAKDPIFDKDIEDKLIIDTFESDEAGNVRQISKQITQKKYDRHDYIESFARSCAMESIIEKIEAGAISEDKFSILKGQEPGQVNDLRGFSELNDLGDIVASADKARVIYASLDPALRKNMSFKEFCSKFNNEDFNAYIKSKVDLANKAADEKAKAAAKAAAEAAAAAAVTTVKKEGDK